MRSIHSIRQSQAERTNSGMRNAVKELVSLKAVAPVIIDTVHPLETLYPDSNPPPSYMDQFTPYLSRKLNRKTPDKTKTRESTPSFLLKRMETPARPQTVAAKRVAISKKYETHIAMEELFDKIAAGSSNAPLHKMVETNLCTFFSAEKVLYYHDISSIQVLYCPTTTLYTCHGKGIVGYTQFSRKILNIETASEHISYAHDENPTAHVLSFPLFDSNNNVCSVVEVIRPASGHLFNDADIEFAEYFQKKCKLYSRWLFQPYFSDISLSEFVLANRIQQFVSKIQDRLKTLFNCQEAELWVHDLNTDQIKMYTSKESMPVVMIQNESGIVGFALRQKSPVSAVNARLHPAYHPKSDGSGEMSVLVIPVKDPNTNQIFAVALRGKRIPTFFTDVDEKLLKKIIPFVISSLGCADILEREHAILEDSIKTQKRLQSLLEVAEILSGELKIESLIPSIMSRACELVNADRCSLFMVNETRDKLVTSFQGGLTNSIEIPINAGIVGFTASTKQVLNIKDAYEDPRFNRATDLATGYRTMTLLCVPIFDDKGEIRGVTEMINKLDGEFSSEDEKLVQVFNVFCGISIENARLYKASIDLSLQLKSFLDISHSLSQSQAVKPLLEEIIKNTRKVIGAVECYFFLDEGGKIGDEPFIHDEDITAKISKKKTENGNSVEMKKAIIASLIQGSEKTKDAAFDKERVRIRGIIDHIKQTKESVFENNAENPKISLIGVPVLRQDGVVIGILLMQRKKSDGKFITDDLKLLEAYAVFISIALERSYMNK